MTTGNGTERPVGCSAAGGRGIGAGRGFRVCLVILAALVPIAASVAVGCGSSSPSPAGAAPDAAATGDGSVTYVSVVTAGGGSGATAADAGNSNPFGMITGDAGDGGSSDDGAVYTGIPDGGIDGDTDAAIPGTCVDYVAPYCGTTPCDLRTSTCCIMVSSGSSNLTITGKCVPGVNATCKQTEATAHCQQSCECPNGKSCCGVASTINGSVQTVCQSVADGGFCQPHTEDPNPAEASEQFCKTDAECKNGQPCIAQTCTLGAMFSLCGLQSQSPFLCKANQ